MLALPRVGGLPWWVVRRGSGVTFTSNVITNSDNVQLNSGGGNKGAQKNHIYVRGNTICGVSKEVYFRGGLKEEDSSYVRGTNLTLIDNDIANEQCTPDKGFSANTALVEIEAWDNVFIYNNRMRTHPSGNNSGRVIWLKGVAGQTAIISNTLTNACTPFLHANRYNQGSGNNPDWIDIMNGGVVLAQNDVSYGAGVTESGDCYELADNRDENANITDVSVPGAEFSQGDLNCDGTVNNADLAFWDALPVYFSRYAVYRPGVDFCASPDIDGDGDVDSTDRTTLVGLIP